jgi:hypothetical protein
MAILVTIRQDYVFSIKLGRPLLTAGGQFVFLTADFTDLG